MLFGFAFEWLFITVGLFAGNAQAAQGMGMIAFPFAFISSAYVPVSSMPGWLQVFATDQPLAYMVDAVRSLTLGPHAQALLGHPSSYYDTRAVIWALAILPISLPLAITRYRRGSTATRLNVPGAAGGAEYGKQVPVRVLRRSRARGKVRLRRQCGHCEAATPPRQRDGAG